MYLSDNIDSFKGIITARQLQLVKNFLNQSFNWSEIMHGEKRKLDDDISAVFLAANGTNDWLNVLEAHRRFFDLHCTLEGADIMVSKPVTDCSNIKTEYQQEGDYILFNESPVEEVKVKTGSYCLVPPADAHMALYGDNGFVRKIVFKIPVVVDEA